uniref:Myosin motor domain-containing protein n=1 Tax=Heterorhabditis bacteriophora TaxID=37862 RepID=A0A1I7XE24_HETBA
MITNSEEYACTLGQALDLQVILIEA